MNEKVLEALQALAIKLGTTADHLWGVLIKQAPIDRNCDEGMSISVSYNENMKYLRNNENMKYFWIYDEDLVLVESA